jgi:Na+/proline symporter
MGIGASILVIAIGAILAFAVDWHVSGLDLHIVGWILMLAGLASVILFFTFWNRRRPVGTVRRTSVVQGDAYDSPLPPPPGP